jgi:hypothetical protein
VQGPLTGGATVRIAAAWGVAILCLAVAQSAAANKRNPAAVALFKKAIAASNIEAEGAQAFRLQATVRVAGTNNRHIDGMLVEFWAPGGRLREETIFPGYQLVEVSDGQHRWANSKTSYVPYSVHDLWSALAFPHRLHEWLTPTGKAWGEGSALAWQRMVRGSPLDSRKIDLAKPKKDGEGEACVRARVKPVYDEQFCFNAVSGDLVREVDKTIGVTYEYFGYSAFGGKSLPRIVRIFGRGRTELAEIHIDKIDSSAMPSPGMFLPMKGSQEVISPGCTIVKLAKVVKIVPPVYPSDAKNHGVKGTVVMYAYLGVDGVLRGLWPVKSPSALLTSASLQAVSQWRYRPTVCESGGVTRYVPMATYVIVIFTLAD